MNHKVLMCMFMIFFVSSLFGLDTVETRKGMKYQGKILRIQDTKNGKAFVMQTVQGGTVAIYQKDVARIKRDNQVIDLITGERYLYEIRRPFLPFTILSLASGAYAVTRFQEYSRLHDQAEKDKKALGVDADTINTNDQKTAMAAGIVSSIVSVGSFIIAIHPMEIKVPLGKVKVSGTVNGINVALHF